MPDIWCDVDVALAEVPVNILPLLDDTDFKSRETGIVYNQAGMDLVWNFVTSAGAMTQTAVTPTTGGDYDWAHQGDAMFSIEIPASGGASINNDTEGYGWFTGFATGVLPWRGPVIGFRAAAINDALCDGGDLLDVSLTQMGGVAQSATDLKDFADAGYDPATNKVQGVVLVDTVTTNTDVRGTDNAALASVVGALTDAAAAGEVTEADTVMQYIKQLINILIGAAGIGAFPAAAAPANAVSLAEVIRQIHTYSVSSAAWGSINSGIVFRGPVTADDPGVSFTVSGLAGQGAGAFVDATTPWYAYVFRDAGGAGAAPQGEMQAVTAYTTATGLFTTDAFTAPVATGDDVIIMSGRIAAVPEIATDVDTLLARLTAARAGYLDNINGHTAQTGDSFARIGAAGASLTDLGGMSTGMKAEVEAECTDAIEADGLDHLVAASVTGTDITDNSIIASLVSKEATADWDDFVNTTDSLQAIRDKQTDIETDTNELQTDWADGGRLDLLLDGASAPSAATVADAVWDEAAADHVGAGSFGVQCGTDIDAILTDTGTTLQAELDGIQTDTENIQSRLPAALVTGRMSSDAVAISGSTDAADKLEASAETIIIGTVSTDNTAATTTTFVSDDVTEATADHYNGRIVIFTSGALLAQATDITDYALDGNSEGAFTVTATTEAPANDDTFVIV